jgi:hypothetical protein
LFFTANLDWVGLIKEEARPGVETGLALGLLMGTKSVNHTLIEIKKATASLQEYLNDQERCYIYTGTDRQGELGRVQ